MAEPRAAEPRAAGRRAARLATAARVAVAFAACAYVVLYVTLALWRLRHPFELEWMEGAMVDHVRRLAVGEPIYAAPSLEFTAFIYPPVFYVASAAVAELTGVGFMALRLVSFLSSLAILALLHAFVVRETRDRLAGLAAVGLFAATYDIGGSFLDLGRVDSMSLAVLLGACYVLRFGRSFGAHVVGGALVGLAFLTKQSALVMAAPVVLYVMHRDLRRGLVTAAVAGVVMLAATLALDAAHGGWYRFYTLELPSRYPLEPHRLVAFWREDVLPPLAIAWAVGLIHLLVPRTGVPRLFHLALAAGLIAGAWLSRGNPGGYNNVLIPAYLAACLLFGLGLSAARTLMSELQEAGRNRGTAWLGAACVLQFALLAYNPGYKLPSRADEAAGQAFVRELAAVEGDVWIPYHGYMATMAGKRAHAHWMALSDIIGYGDDSLRQAMQHQIDSALEARRFGLIVQSTSPFADTPELEPSYAAVRRALHDDDVLWPVTGSPRRVELLYVPR